MTVTAQQKLTNAYNEFIRDYVEAHGQNQAIRDEAHERAGKLTAMGQSVVEFINKFVHDKNTAYFMIDAIPEIDAEEAYLVACAVAVALEEVK